MLARSPVPSSSPANASPRNTFQVFHHYAPAPSPRYPSPRLPAVAQSRRPSTDFPAAAPARASPTQPKRYVAVDAATQYSPMEPMDYATGTLLPRVPPTTTATAATTPTTSTTITTPISTSKPDNHTITTKARSPMAAPEERPVNAAHPGLRPHKPISSGSKQFIDAPSLPTSPSKRKSSQEPASISALAAEPLQNNPSTIAKRAKPDTAPPKVLPQRYELCAIEDVVVLIAHMLGELIETNDTLALKSGHLTRFHSRTAPGISVLDYLHRLAKHATLTPPLLLSMVYYIDRLCALYPDFTINTLTVHRFLITAATVAAKGLSDAFWNNSTYACVGGIKVAELKLLELEFLHRVDWKIVPNPEVLVAYYQGLVERCPGYTLEAPETNEGSGESDALDESDELDDDDTTGDAHGSASENGLTPSGRPSPTGA
ncbi:cyclin-domain-containing protein [Chaetomium sp. MPI-SDFR-AT-0129]|nr:cyclin-domain-containing protein [Chaetomium sp. MPI-SDFR-AT-0129]